MTTEKQQTENAHEDTARLWKAVRLTDWIDANVVRQFEGDARTESIEALPNMPELWWKGVAGHAGVHPPSSKTIALVVQLMTERHAPTIDDGTDPLAGLPRADDRPPALRGCCG